MSTRAGGEPVYEFNAAARARRIRFGAAEHEAVRAAAVTVVSCVAFDDQEQTAELAAALAGAGGLVAIDPNPRAGMLRDRAAFVAGFERVAARADLVKLGEDDARLLYDASLNQVAMRLRERGAGAVLATRGASGAAVFAPDAASSLPATAVAAPIVDTMGAGDAVLASAVASLLSSRPMGEQAWGELLRTAMDVAAATCRFEGALLRLPSAMSGLGGGFGGS